MNFIKLQPEYFDRWNAFCANHHFFWHSTYWLEYLKNSKFNTLFIDHSFFVEQDKQIVAIIPLLQEGVKLFSPGIPDDKSILREVEHIALEHEVKHIETNSQIKEWLNISGYTCVLDLDDIQPTKGHKAAIKKGREKLYLSWPDSDTERFRKDYFHIAGKATRPNYTFELLRKWILNDYGLLFRAVREGMNSVTDCAGYAYVLVYGERAYYFMSCVEPSCKKYNVSHFLQDKIFDLLRRKGVKYYELGEQVYNSLVCLPSEKEKGISLFKRGFGGKIVTAPKSELFLDRDYFFDTYMERIKKYQERIV